MGNNQVPNHGNTLPVYMMYGWYWYRRSCNLFHRSATNDCTTCYVVI